MEKLLNIDQVSELLGLSKKTIYAYTSARKLKHVKIGALLRWRESDLEAYVESRVVKTVEELVHDRV